MPRLFPTGLFLLLLAGCTPTPDRAPVLGEAYVGPATLQIRSDLVARAPVSATVTHGERVEVIGRRRTMYRIRTKDDAEGWIDGRQLLNTADMSALASLREKAKTLSSLGKATVFDLLNVHTIPNRSSPSFFQIKPEERVDVVGYARAPRIPYEANLGIRFASARAAKRRVQRADALADLPAPKAPPLPANWLELSGNPKIASSPLTPAADPNPMDDWALVRAADGRAGWVLARILWMALPEEVAQYAERARIIAYFPLNAPAGARQMPAWFWTTRSAAAPPGADFDGARVFVYNSRRSRYETAWFEKRIRGFLPVSAGKPGPIGLAPFRFNVEEPGGQLVTREYAFQGERPHLVSRKPAGRTSPLYVPGLRFNAPADDAEGVETPQGFLNRLKSWVSSLRSSRS